MSKAYCNLIYHIVFGTKGLKTWLKKERALRIHPYLGGIVRKMGGIPFAINGHEEHVHILAKLRQDRSIMDFLRDLKANSSKWVHNEYHEISDFGWQTGYGAFTVSGAHIDHLKIYIADQEEHHRRITFKEEYLQLLKEHGIEYDERYIWD